MTTKAMNKALTMGQIEQSSCHETEKFSHLLLFEGAGRD
jgi:hypothetical protein